MKYECNDVFMIRNPSLPIKTFTNLQKEEIPTDEIVDYLTKYHLLNFINESLLISSKSLYSAFKDLGKDRKRDHATKRSLFKYLIRASTRPTPYGILSSVTLGNFNKTEDITMKILNQRKLDVKVDTYWICKVISALENNKDLIKKIKVKWNNACYISGKRLKNPYYTHHGCYMGEDNPISKVDIQYNLLIKLIMSASREFISFQELKKIIMDKYTDVPESVVSNTLELLIENEFLYTELRLPPYNEDNLKYVINILKRVDGNNNILFKLVKIHKKIQEYQSQDTQDYNLLVTIYKEMSEVQNSKNYLEVNLTKTTSNCNLSTDIKTKMENFVNSLSDLYIEKLIYSRIKKFKSKFSEKYGYHIEVPILEIIDENKFNGLEYLENDNLDKTEREILIHKIIDNKIQETLIKGKNILSLRKDDFIEVIHNQNKENIVTSFDLNVIITKTTNNKTHLTIGPNYGSYKAGNTFQRFENLLDTSLLTHYNKIYEVEKDINKGSCLLVEARELEVNGRANNLTNNKKNYEYYISLGHGGKNDINQIYLEDLSIGMDTNNKLYIKSISKGKIIKVISDNMLTSSTNSKLLYLLKEISNEYEENKVIERLSMLFSNHYVYTPRIDYEGVTISPRKWIFTEEQFNTDNLAKFKSDFLNLKKSYKVDNMVYLCNNDNRLIMNLNNVNCFEIFFREIKSEKKIVLCEIEEGLLEGGIITDTKNNSYISEAVFSFSLAKYERKNTEVSNSDNLLLTKKDRIFPIFADGWLYFKVYGMGNKENQVISSLNILIMKLENPKFFYIRYNDTIGKHLRIRFKFKDENEAINNIIVINKWLQELKEKAYIREWSLNQYEREIGRYGGNELIEDIETLFWMDSKYIIEIFKRFDISNEEEKEIAGFIGLSSLLIILSGDKNNAFKILDKHWNNRNYRKEFKKYRRLYMSYMEKICLDSFVEIVPNSKSNIIKIVDNRVDIASRIYQKLQNIDQHNRTNIILSIIHMFCNRFEGDLLFEHKLHSLVRNTLYSLLEKEKHTNLNTC